jgi:hypothetical protein
MGNALIIEKRRDAEDRFVDLVGLYRVGML